jgi:hypothetical protein
MPRRANGKKGYLVAEPSGFPGVRIPLLSDEECRARGIEPGRLPPRETWTQQQREAADRLIEMLLPHVFREALQVILAELEREPADPAIPEKYVEEAAASHGIALIDAGKWKQRDTWIHRPSSWIRQVLEMIARGDLAAYCDGRDAPSGPRSRPRAPVYNPVL